MGQAGPAVGKQERQTARSPDPLPPEWRQVSSVMQRNIEALRDRRQQQEARAAAQDRIADVVTRFAGSLAFVCAHIAIVAGWVAVNSGWLGITPFDPSFVILAT